MPKTPEFIVFSARNCRRSQEIMAYLDDQQVAYTAIPLKTPRGRKLAQQHGLNDSPGILVDEVSINPFEIIITPACLLDEARPAEVFNL